MIQKLAKTVRTAYVEGIFWILSLAVLAFIDPEAEHFTICPFSNLGIHFCPGCGLGRSISMLFNLNFIESFNAHPLGIFAVTILIFRIYTIFHTAVSIKFLNERKLK